MNFEWDEPKRKSNFDKHGVDLLAAALIFEGPCLTRIDDRYDYGETRYISLGETDGECFVVVHTERNGAIRLISAWRGSRRDRAEYQARFAGRPSTDEGQG